VAGSSADHLHHVVFNARRVLGSGIFRGLGKDGLLWTCALPATIVHALHASPALGRTPAPSEQRQLRRTTPTGGTLLADAGRRA
jgi:hypothetical protein